MRRAVLLACATVAAACGADRRPTPPPPVAVPPTAEAPPRGPDDVVVATVNGRPVWGSCVAAQVEHAGVDRAAALDQCVAFELLAQEADARGLREDAEVAEAWRREMVRALIEAELGAIDTIDEIPAEVREPLLARNGGTLEFPPMRTAYYVRVPVPRGAAPGGPEDEAARQVAAAIHAELADAPTVLPDDLFAAGERHRGALAIETNPGAPYPTPEHEIPGVRVAVEEFRRALFAIPEIGRISPPVKTIHGWFVVLWWDDLPARDLRPSFLEFARLHWFRRWAGQIAKGLGLEPWIDEARLAALAEADLGAGVPAATEGGP